MWWGACSPFIGGFMKSKSISELSYLTHEQKEIFSKYILFENGNVVNEKTGKEVSKTLHGTRGYVVNLVVHVDKKRVQKQIVIHKAVADLFIGPLTDGYKLTFVDGNKENICLSNLAYRMTEKQRKAEYSKCLTEMKGITEEGRVCSVCKEFKNFDEFPNAGVGSAVCLQCANKRSIDYQRSVNFSHKPVPFETYCERLDQDNPQNINGNIGLICCICGNIFLPSRGMIANRVNTIKSGKTPKSPKCKQCKEK